MPIRPKNRARLAESMPTIAGASAASAIVARPRVRSLPSSPPDELPGRDDTSAAIEPAAVKRVHHIVDRTGPNWDEAGEYIVGKGRPPSHSRWQKGQSGNPRGPKPKEKLDPLAEFERELTADFVARVNGKDVQLNTGTFVLQLLKAGAAKGTVKAQQLLLEYFLAAVRKEVDRDGTPEALDWEQQVIDQMLEDHGLPARPVVRRERQATAAPDAGEGGER